MAEVTPLEIEEYKNVTQQFRTLTDIRFKLLGYLPLGTVGTFVLAKEGSWPPAGIGVFGLATTIALAIYDQRNDELYDELVSRAAEIERRGRIFDGSFAQRPAKLVSLARTLFVEHRWPVALIYGAAAALWLFVAARPLARHLSRAAGITSAWWMEALLGITCALAALVASNHISERRKDAAIRARGAVKRAIADLEKIEGAHVPATGAKARAIEIVAGTVAAGWPRLSFEAVHARLLFYLTSSPEMEQFLPRMPVAGPIGRTVACEILAYVADVPARWVRDLISGRRAV